MVRNNTVIMRGKNRSICQAAKMFLMPAAFAAMLPLSGAIALPSKTMPDAIRLAEKGTKKQNSALLLSAAIDLRDGMGIYNDLCERNYPLLLRKHRLIMQKSAKMARKELIQGMAWDTRVMQEAMKSPGLFSKQDLEKRALSSIRSNFPAVRKLFKSDPGPVKEYLDAIGLANELLSFALKQSFNNGDPLIFYEQMRICVCPMKK